MNRCMKPSERTMTHPVRHPFLTAVALLSVTAGCVQPGASPSRQAATLGGTSPPSQEELKDALADFEDLFVATVKQAAADIDERIQDVDTRVKRNVDQAGARADLMTDHLSWRIGQLLVLGFLLTLAYRLASTRITRQAR